MLNETLSVAPMLDWTDRHLRYMLRGITKHTVLYTEMIVDDAVNHSNALDFLIGKDIEEYNSVIQVGGHDPENLAKAVRLISLKEG
jgi:tRNA-dihydrouridine synthase A